MGVRRFFGVIVAPVIVAPVVVVGAFAPVSAFAQEPPSEPLPPDSTTTTTTTTRPLVSSDPSIIGVPLDEEQLEVISGPAPSFPLPAGFAEEVGVPKRRSPRTVKKLLPELHHVAAAQVVDMYARDVSFRGLSLAQDRRAGDAAAIQASLVHQQELLQRKMIRAYVGQRDPDLEVAVDATAPAEIERASTMFDMVIDADDKSIETTKRQGQTLQHQVMSANAQLSLMQPQIVGTWQRATDAHAAYLGLLVELTAMQLGIDIRAPRFTFPIAGPYAFSDGWHAPRMIGTENEHLHVGTDIFAPMGTPLVACEPGVVFMIGEAGLGGKRVWIQGASGTRYYYAHLSGFAPGLIEGQVVSIGQVVGYVGNTGNAQGGAPHLHFQVHTAETGEAINPYPLLVAITGEKNEKSLRLPGLSPVVVTG